jgi:thymidylate synthase
VIPYEFNNFQDAIRQASHRLQYRSKVVHSARWQGSDIANMPEMATHEVQHASFAVMLEGKEDLNHWRLDIGPNLPWADDHFLERVCGMPINPGTEWKNWPYGKSAERFLDDQGMFNHNYMERYWPKYAGLGRITETASNTPEDFVNLKKDFDDTLTRNHGMKSAVNHGIFYDYGDLNDVVQLLADDPYTRQAYLPVWFPEDTGGGSKRAPCTIGYHFLMRDDRMDISYQIRSCDYVRHFRDDCYLTVRLLLWVIDRLREIDNRYVGVRPGKYVMSIQSLHVFRNDYIMLFGKRS